MPIFKTSAITYHYSLAIGSGPLLLLHGFTGSAQNWSPLSKLLPGNQPIVALDLPGHGLSDVPADPAAYTMPKVADDVIALLDHLHLQRIHLLGYSMGGRLALYLALNYPHRWRSLILESASPGLATASERQSRVAADTALAAIIEEQGIEAFVRRWESLSLFASQQRLPDAIRQGHRAARLRNHPVGLANSLRGMGAGAQPSLWDDLSRLKTPVLLLVGEMDAKFVNIARQMALQMPNARIDIISGAGHTVHLERPQRYAERLAAWLERISTS